MNQLLYQIEALKGQQMSKIKTFLGGWQDLLPPFGLYLTIVRSLPAHLEMLPAALLIFLREGRISQPILFVVLVQ